MNPELLWSDILVRLATGLTVGIVFGIDRGEQGTPVGIRTTTLVCLASVCAMIAANALLTTTGKTPASFGTLDSLRLPLGVLSGMGFIGAGAILKRGEAVAGLTTAATLWYLTVLGICIGAGLIGLSLIAAILGIVVLSVLKKVERILPKFRRGKLTVRLHGRSALTAEQLARIIPSGQVKLWALARSEVMTLLTCEVLLPDGKENERAEEIVERLRQRADVVSAEWQAA